MTITCTCIQKTFSLDVEDQLCNKWAFFKGEWRQLKPKHQDEDWYEDYCYRIASTRDMLECWLGYLPGVEGWDDYCDFSVTFDLKDVEEAGWNEQQLKDVLEDMARYVRMRGVIHANPPWQSYKIDAYGHHVNYYRHPAIEPLSGMLDREYPLDLEPTG